MDDRPSPMGFDSPECVCVTNAEVVEDLRLIETRIWTNGG